MTMSSESKSKCSYTLSARGKQLEKDTPIIDYARRYFGAIPFEQVDSIFDFVEPSTLYGGRPFQASELSDDDVTALYR